MKLYDNKYTFVKAFGYGGFGKVFLAKEKVSNRLVAIKQLLNAAKSEQEDIIHEIETILKFDNPNIVSCYHHFWEDEILMVMLSTLPYHNQ
jgi:serine/threonine protein kinase